MFEIELVPTLSGCETKWFKIAAANSQDAYNQLIKTREWLNGCWKVGVIRLFVA